MNDAIEMLKELQGLLKVAPLSGGYAAASACGAAAITLGIVIKNLEKGEGK